MKKGPHSAKKFRIYYILFQLQMLEKYSIVEVIEQEVQ